MWKGRFSQETNEIVGRFTQSLDLDWRTVQEDIRGSAAHVRMLAKMGLLTEEEAKEAFLHKYDGRCEKLFEDSRATFEDMELEITDIELEV